jgi:drug/metabolite transporter (DMT)-like permease
MRALFAGAGICEGLDKRYRWRLSNGMRGDAIIDRDWVIIIALGFGWGTTFFFNEMLLRDIGPLSVSLVRVSIAAVTVWVYLAATGQYKRVSAQALAAMALLGALMFAIPFAIYPLGQQYVASAVAGIVNALTPEMVVVISHFWPGGERATLHKSLGVLAGFLGILLLTIPAFNSGESTRLFGTLVIVLAPVSYACAMNWVRRLSGTPVPVMVAWAFSFAALLLVPAVLMVEGVPARVTGTSVASGVFLGTVLTGAFFLIGFQILPRAGATKTSTVTFIAPISALLIGWLVLGEELGLPHFLGMGAIFLGLLLIDGRVFRSKVN